MSASGSIHDVARCTGCTACGNACPKKAIRMEPDALGFLRASVDAARCVGCGLCRKVCPALSESEATHPLQAFYGWNRDEAIRAASSSGGVFSALAESVLEDGGLVMGAVFDAERNIVRHASSDEVPLSAFRGSKYVQSDLGTVFQTVRETLATGRRVLFVGTPCQVHGLRALVGVPENLILCDFICHGAGSPAVFRENLARLSSAAGAEAESVSFRSKRRGWTNSSTEIRFRNGRRYARRNVFDTFFQGYVDGAYFGPACYDCPFEPRMASDIRLSDFWGYRKFGAIPEAEKGLTLLFVNTECGRKALAKAQAKLETQEVPVEDALAGQRHSEAARQAAKAKNTALQDLIARYGIRKALGRYIGFSLPGIVFRKIKRVGPQSVFRRILRRIRKG